MRRQIIVMFLSLFWIVLPNASAVERGALFKVAGGGHTMYLFGTIHVGLPEFYPLEPRIAAAVAGASVLALEVDPSMDPERIAKAFQEHAMFAPGSAAYGAMPPALKARLERVLEAAQLDQAVVARFKPWMVATLLAIAQYGALGYRVELSVDLHLAQLAHAGKVPVLELESAEAQVALFSRLSEAEQWRLLEESIDMIESGRHRAEALQIAEAWRNGDRAAFDAIAEHAENDPSLSAKFMQQVVLKERNGPLAEQLVRLLARSDKSVAAIGVLHLLGKESVPALLRARGMAVERVY